MKTFIFNNRFFILGNTLDKVPRTEEEQVRINQEFFTKEPRPHEDAVALVDLRVDDRGTLSLRIKNVYPHPIKTWAFVFPDSSVHNYISLMPEAVSDELAFDVSEYVPLGGNKQYTLEMDVTYVDLAVPYIGEWPNTQEFTLSGKTYEPQPVVIV